MLTRTLLGIPYSFTAHAKDIYHDEVDQDVLRVKMRRAALVITVSEFNRHTLLRVGDGIAGLEQKLVRAYNGVDLAFFQPAPTDGRIPGRMLAVGRLVEKKGFFILIQACGLLAQRGVPFSCHLIGSGEEEPALRALVRAPGASAGRDASGRRIASTCAPTSPGSATGSSPTPPTGCPHEITARRLRLRRSRRSRHRHQGRVDAHP